MKERSPKPLSAVGDVAEPKAVQHESSQQDHKCCGESDATEGAPYAADTEFIQGLAPIQSAAQSRALHHKSLQKRGDGHQSQAPGQDHEGQHRLPEAGQICADVDDRESGHRDR